MKRLRHLTSVFLIVVMGLFIVGCGGPSYSSDKYILAVQKQEVIVDGKKMDYLTVFEKLFRNGKWDVSKENNFGVVKYEAIIGDKKDNLVLGVWKVAENNVSILTFALRVDGKESVVSSTNELNQALDLLYEIKEQSKGKKEKESSAAQQNDTQKEYMLVQVNDLLRDLKNNAAAASRKYKGKQVKILGYLRGIESNADYISIGSNEEFEMAGVQAFTHNDKKLIDDVTKLRNGQQIMVCGKITDVGEILGYSLRLDKIIFLNGDPSSRKEATRSIRGVWQGTNGSVLTINSKSFGKEPYTVSDIDTDNAVITLTVSGKRIVKISYEPYEKKEIVIGNIKYTKIRDVGSAE